MTDLLIYNIGELVVGPDDDGESLRTLTDAALVIEDGVVATVGPSEQLCREFPPESADAAIDVSGRVVTPGFVDPHTHALFAGDRSDEFVARIEGATYTEIMERGGGIPVTVEAIREASDQELLENLLTQLDVMLAHGTTTAEVKSGYGLDVETELRMLEVIEQADEIHPVDLIPTFMGAHAVPQERETDDYVEEVITDQLPAVANQRIAKFCDVFCEDGVFTVEQSRRILEAGREHGLEPKLHAEEFSHIGGAQLAADLEATSADHLLSATQEDATALTEAGVVPVLLPATAFSLSEPYADASMFADAGAPIALGTDLNPSCFVHNQAFVLSLACLRMGMTPAEALLGTTYNAARAVGRTNGLGTLDPGTSGDLVIFDLPDYVHVPYNAGSNRVSLVVKDGAIVVEDGTVLEEGTVVQDGGRPHGDGSERQ